MKRWALLLFILISVIPGRAWAATVGPEGWLASPDVAATSSAEATPPASAPLTFAVIGDYGTDDAHERAVANLVASWNPAFVIAVGDDYYASAGGTGTGKYDESTGAYYGRWLKDISTTGVRMPTGEATRNAFFPALGNHDYTDAVPAPATYLTYFTLPGTDFTSTSGNERYYDFVDGPVHFFVLNSNTAEPDGVSSTSIQAQWLRSQLASSTSTFNIVYDHHPPYSSDNTHGSTTYMQWPFAAWGADAVISGHAHVYERVMHDGIPYFVNGLGGGHRHAFAANVPGSAARYQANWGAQKVTVTDAKLTFRFYSVGGGLIDSYPSTGAEISIKRSPSASTLTYKRRHGVARFTLSAIVRGTGGTPARGVVLWLQASKNGKSRWRNAYRFVTGSAGKASKSFRARKPSKTFYRWRAAGSTVTLTRTTGKQRVVVK